MAEQPRNYNVCTACTDGKHVTVDAYDPEQPEGYSTVACNACGITTGIPIPPLAEIEWN